MQKIFHISPLETVGDRRAASFWHIRRFAIKSSVGFSTVILFKQLMTLAVSPIMRYNDSYMIAETDVHLLKVINALGLKTRKIGKSVTYLASGPIPICSAKEELVDFYRRWISIEGVVHFYKHRDHGIIHKRVKFVKP